MSSFALAGPQGPPGPEGPQGPQGDDGPQGAPGAGLFDGYALLRDQKAAGTHGGAATTGSFQTRVLNTESFDPNGIVSLSSNQFTLAAGTYFIRARAPFYQTERSLLKIRNVTDSADAIIGQVAFATDTASEPSAVDATMAQLAGRITISGTKAFELQYRVVGNGGGDDRCLGIECNFGVVEVYSEVEIWREAS